MLSKNYIRYTKLITPIQTGGNIIKAIAQITKATTNEILGYVEFSDDGNMTTIHGNIKGLPKGKHGFHVHESGDPRKCCDALGAHYNPFNKQHGDRLDGNRHLGDLGNIEFNDNNECVFSFVDKMIKLSGNYSIIGRSLIIHEKEDDLGKTDHELSKTTGNSGGRVAYGIIGYAK